MSPQQAHLYSQHCFRHFLPQVSSEVDSPEIANLNVLELLRHAASTLNASPQLAPADKARAKFVVSATAVSWVYGTNETMTRLIKISQQKMNRVHKHRGSEQATAFLFVFVRKPENIDFASRSGLEVKPQRPGLLFSSVQFHSDWISIHSHLF